ncbi:MAG: hypothetical protein M3Z16_12745, partial [Pseudomonadota bacterium]|nr:hypothetical protein [Pseudomonadota bacterium]
TARRTARGRLVMALVLAICAAPVVAAYVAYFIVRPEGRSNYSDLIQPARPLPTGLPLTDLGGRPVSPAALRGQWLLVVVGGGACDSVCERQLLLQRQLHESLGRERDRVDKLWLVDDGVAPREPTLRAIKAFGHGSHLPFAAATVLHSPGPALAAWLQPAARHGLADHLYVVDPRGDWMMRAPADADPGRLKRDLEKLLRASAGWDQAGR